MMDAAYYGMSAMQDAAQNHAAWQEWYDDFSDRILKEEGYKKVVKRMDYSALSVGVMTLGLIMVVEVIKHKIDHAALGRPYFTAVLHNIYEELSTLGIVEFAVFLLQTYYEDMDKDKKNVFGDVHFALFYTAIFNAGQSIILAFLATRISRRIWVRTEALELDHYVEVREEFDRVSRELEPYRRHKKAPSSEVPQGDEEIPSSPRNVSALVSGLNIFRYYTLKRQYNRLLIQVRFHNLRVHFLEAYNLPANFKVSDYLIRSEQQVLIKLVHISINAWLLLTAAINLLYYILGIVSTKTGSASKVGNSLIYIFFCSIWLFVVVAIAVHSKVKRVFKAIMHGNQFWEMTEDHETNEQFANEQRHLFWGGNPKLIIAALQFMQFGYAIALSVVIIFWEEINDGGVAMMWYWIAILGCYSCYVVVAAQVIPRYTLCTSLGQLVDKSRLHEAVARYKLEEAKRKLSMGQMLVHKEAGAKVIMTVPGSTLEGKLEASARPGNHRGTVSSATALDDSPSVSSGGSSPKAGEIAVEMETQTRAQQIAARRQRRKRSKAVSDGVALMRSWRAIPEDEDVDGSQMVVAQPTMAGDLASQDIPLDRQRSRMKFSSEGAASMASFQGSESSAADSDRLAQFVKMDTKSLRASLSAGELAKMAERANTKRTRPRKQKSDSDGVQSMVSVSSGGSASASVEASAVSSIHGGGASASVATSKRSNSLSLYQPKEISDEGSVVSFDSSDAHSDADDVPDVDPLQFYHVEHKPPVPFRERCRNYFLSKRYAVFSNVFGTMVAFFLVGSRVERFLHTDNIVGQYFISFDFDETWTFWLLSGWFISFILIDALALFSLGDYASLLRLRERKVWVATAMDLIICSTCFLVFYMAELKRCCTTGNGDDGKGEYLEYTYPDPAPCECRAFGSRLYGGLGFIEPYVSLIALRLFRFWTASRIVHKLDSNRGLDMTKSERIQENKDMDNLDPFDVFSEHGNHHNGNGDHGKHDGHGHDDHDHGHGHESKGTPAEIWEKAVREHPDIVAKYGEFSSELLLAMLGLPIVDMTSLSSASSSDAGMDRRADLAHTKPDSFVLDKQYAGLPVDTQEIIMAGKVGHKVRSMRKLDPLDLNGISDALPGGDEDADRRLVFQAAPSTSNLSVTNEFTFDSPDAPLIRNMRRCDRKFLPILGTWSVVDVVMTRFEMVYFDASHVDETFPDSTTKPIREALIVTHGGKGLRLCDVAAGRQVVGHLRFSEIASIGVLREMPSDIPREGDTPNVEVRMTEFWQSKSKHVHFNRGEAWHKYTQDSLKIQTVHGHVLYLRYYSDLEDALHHPNRQLENETEGPLYVNNALQWVKTIGRLCGPDQLKQALPHFGDETSDELRDYMIVKHAVHDHYHHTLPRLHLARRSMKRGSSFGDAPIVEADRPASDRSIPAPKKAQRQQTV